MHMMRTLVIIGAASGVACGVAAAQQSSDPNQQSQPQVIHPAPSTGLGGVRATAPRATTPVVVPQLSPPVQTTPIAPTPAPVTQPGNVQPGPVTTVPVGGGQ